MLNRGGSHAFVFLLFIFRSQQLHIKFNKKQKTYRVLSRSEKHIEYIHGMLAMRFAAMHK